MDSEFLAERIAATKLQIIAYEDAALALGTGNVESYMLDTGQTKQMVTKLNLASIQRTIDGLYSRCAVLQTRLDGGGTMSARPNW